MSDIMASLRERRPSFMLAVDHGGSRAKAIEAKCLDCCNGQRAEAVACLVTDCALYPYAYGRKRGPGDVPTAAEYQSRIEADPGHARRVEQGRRLAAGDAA